MSFFSFLRSHITLLEFLSCFFQVTEDLIHIFRILSTELLLVFDESCLHKAMIIFNLVECNHILLNSILFIKWLLFIENSIFFFNFSFIYCYNYWFELFNFFWWLVVPSFEFLISLFKIIKNLINILFILGSEFFLLINKLLTKLHVSSRVVMLSLNSIYLRCLWKQHADSKWNY